MKIRFFLCCFLIFSTSLKSAHSDEEIGEYLARISREIRSEIRYQNLEEISYGGFGFVFHYRDHVVKISPLDHSDGMINNILEACLLNSLFHPGIPVPLAIKIHDGKHNKYLEIHLPRLHHINKVNAKQILKEMASLLTYLHSINIAHRDIRAIHLLEHDGKIKLIDFGSADIFCADPIRQIGTQVNYRSPELLLGVKNFPKENDTWSLGLSVLTLVNNQPVFYDDERKILSQLLSPITIPSDSDEEFEEAAPSKRSLSFSFQRLLDKSIANTDEIMDHIFMVDPEKRISAEILGAYFGNEERLWQDLLSSPPKAGIENNETFAMRHELFLWMYELTYRFRFPPKIIFEAMSIADQFFMSTEFSPLNVKGMGAVALFLAGGFYYKEIDTLWLYKEAGFERLESFNLMLFTLLKNAHFNLIFNHSLRHFQDELYNKELSSKDRDMIITLLLLVELEEFTFCEDNETKWRIATSIFRNSQTSLDYVRVLCQRFRNTFIGRTASFKAILKKIPARRRSMTLESTSRKEWGF